MPIVTVELDRTQYIYVRGLGLLEGYVKRPHKSYVCPRNLMQHRMGLHFNASTFTYVHIYAHMHI